MHKNSHRTNTNYTNFWHLKIFEVTELLKSVILEKYRSFGNFVTGAKMPNK